MAAFSRAAIAVEFPAGTCLLRAESGESGLCHAHDFCGHQPLDLGRIELQLRQDRCAVLADARRGSLNRGRGAVETGCRLGLADAADVRVDELGDQLARKHLLVGDHLAAPQYRC